MYNFIIRILACFIADKQQRRNFRKKYLQPTLKNVKKLLLDVQTANNANCTLIQEQLNHIKNITIDVITDNKSNYNTINDIQCKLDTLMNQSKETPNYTEFREKLNYIKNFLTVTTDITKVPSCYGLLRLIQKSSLKVLKRFDEIARKYNIQYWLDSGTLIGAVRHSDFIPWDDDMDICMLRSDYDKLLTILEKEFVDSDFHFSHGEIIRLFYKKTPAQVDIFPIDQGWQSDALVENEKKDFIDKLNEIKRSIIYTWQPNLEQQKPVITEEELKKALEKRDTILMNGHKKKKEGFCFLGIETSVSNRCLFSYEEIFPLKEHVFCGLKTYIPNNAFLYLQKMYGDFMNFPDDMYPKHSDIQARLTLETINDMINLVDDK